MEIIEKIEKKAATHFIIIIAWCIAFGLAYGLIYENKEITPATPQSSAEATTEQTTAITTEPTTSNLLYLGEFQITAYCSCAECCGIWANNRPTDIYGEEIVLTASGNVAIALRTVAVDPSVIPYGTVLVIDGRTYVAEDTGAAVKGNIIDIYFADHAQAVEYGKQTKDVYIKKGIY